MESAEEVWSHDEVLAAQNATIQSIPLNDVHRICSGQVIIDIANAVKELVENALDAGATRVEIKLKESGFECFEVSDNGSGISKGRDREFAVKKHFTSKLKEFSDLTSVASYGFRGEALSSIAELAGSFVITTRTVEDETASKCTYDRSGALVEEVVAARATGTTVSVTNLFERLPVRRKEFQMNLKKHYARLLYVLQSYALISVGVRISLTNQIGESRSAPIATQGASLMANVSSVFGPKFLSELQSFRAAFELSAESRKGSSTPASQSARASPGAARGTKVFEQLGADDSTEHSSAGSSTPTKPREPAALSGALAAVEIEGFVSKSKTGVARTGSERQFLFINNRPVDLKKFTTALNEVWRQYEMNHKPACVLNLKLPRGLLDVNVSPDKRDVFLSCEDDVLAIFKEKLHELWEPSRFTFQTNTITGMLQPPRAPGTISVYEAAETGEATPTPPKSAAPAPRAQPMKERIVQEDTSSEEEMDVDDPEEVNQGQEERSAPRHQIVAQRPTPVDPEPVAKDSVEAVIAPPTREPEIQVVSEKAAQASLKRTRAPSSSPSSLQNKFAFEEQSLHSEPMEVLLGDEDDELEASKTPLKRARPAKASTKSPPLASPITAHSEHECCGHEEEDHEEKEEGSRSEGKRAKTVVDPDEDVSTSTTTPLVISSPPRLFVGTEAELLELDAEENARASAASLPSASLTPDPFASTLFNEEESTEQAEAALSRVFAKRDFLAGEIIGQFNLGFIVARFGDDLYVLDQHASDEKFRFETLQKTTTIEHQKLMAPLRVELTASEAQIVREHLAEFERNGFKFEPFDEEERSDADGDPYHNCHSVRLTQLPYSKNIIFGPEDLRELAALLSERGANAATTRLPKIRSMFASRACRSATMIGDHLDTIQMATIVSQLSTLEQPWNCPHGRPTMRHLLSLKELRQARSLGQRRREEGDA